MAREGTNAHQLSLQSGELPMASSAAIGCIAEALRQLRASTAAIELGGEQRLDWPSSANEMPSTPFGGGGMQFAVADVEWWRSPWPSHSLLQGVMHRLPPPQPDEPPDEAAEEEDAPPKRRKAKARAKGGKSKGGGGLLGCMRANKPSAVAKKVL